MGALGAEMELMFVTLKLEGSDCHKICMLWFGHDRPVEGSENPLA